MIRIQLQVSTKNTLSVEELPVKMIADNSLLVAFTSRCFLLTVYVPMMTAVTAMQKAARAIRTPASMSLGFNTVGVIGRQVIATVGLKLLSLFRFSLRMAGHV
jgi:hypothetical protein